MKKAKTGEQGQQNTEGLNISHVKSEHLGKTFGFDNALFVLSDKDLIREKTPPFQNIVIPAISKKQLEFLYKNGFEFLFKSNINLENGSDTSNEYGDNAEKYSV
jgi:hypothetical protein